MIPETVAPSSQFKAGTVAVVVAIAAIVAYARFGGAVGLPAKPPPPSAGVPLSEQLDQIAGSEQSWRTFVERDAATAGLPAPSPQVMARKLRYRSQEDPTVIEPGQSIDVAGLRLTVAIEADTGTRRLLVLRIKNLTDRPLAYQVKTAPRPGGAACNQRSILSHNALVVEPGAEELRSECSYRAGMALGIDRVETMELEPLMALYVSRLPPHALGVEARLSRGHRPRLPGGWTVCGTLVGQAMQAAIDRGQIAWRDLVDFYARHRCETYAFFDGYRAFDADGARALPAVGGEE